MQLSKEFFERDADRVAKELLGKVLIKCKDGVGIAGVIAETESYTADDPASHSYRGKTARNAPMFLGGGFIYVYQIYGRYHCFNLTTGLVNAGEAVLIRSLLPIPVGLVKEINCYSIASYTCKGPGLLCDYMNIDRQFSGQDVTLPTAEIQVHDFQIKPSQIFTTPRIGITQATDALKRWHYVNPMSSPHKW